jgi:MoaA/NifB/PqqE/SkfB family radical SAM enzyme
MNGETARCGPFYATVDVTRRCNLHCPGCRYHSYSIEMRPSLGNYEVLDIDVAFFQRVCSELRAMGTQGLILMGDGEPFLHRQLFELIAVAKENDLHLTVFTNGTLLDDKRIKALIAAQPDVLKVSLWGGTAEDYARNYPGAPTDNFNRISEGLQRLAAAKKEQHRSLPITRLHHPINRNNFRNLDATLDLALQTGCDELSFSPFKTRGGRLTEAALTADEERDVCANLRQIGRWLEALTIKHNIRETLFRYRIGEAVWKKMPCYIGWLHVRVKVDGVVFACNSCDWPLGNLNECALRDIWNSQETKIFRRQAMTRWGLTLMADRCTCEYCCHAGDNWRVHRMLRFLPPFIGRR